MCLCCRAGSTKARHCHRRGPRLRSTFSSPLQEKKKNTLFSEEVPPYPQKNLSVNDTGGRGWNTDLSPEASHWVRGLETSNMFSKRGLETSNMFSKRGLETSNMFSKRGLETSNMINKSVNSLFYMNRKSAI
ncbi:hypothetical protein CEXT_155741 [Caerostris extrusa]|uniref:Uncharacterized protein n=1 Tax=Caerostris extrusa TaxID=172846 RepID=A0AAV4T7C6_CAEEX|nr:hypothetical protein CEXT_155741 [Caerostris extrusa]